jgi:hypothetical protein
MSENKPIVEMHGCIVCGRIYNVFAIYTQDGRLVDCTVTSPSGHCVPDERQPLVTCDTHTAREIETAYKIWKSRKVEELVNEKADE